MTFDRTRPPRVQEHPNADPSPGPTTKSLGHFDADLALPVDKSEKVDRVLGATNSVQHRREDLTSVAQHRDTIALARGNPDDAFERASHPVNQLGRNRRRTGSVF